MTETPTGSSNPTPAGLTGPVRRTRYRILPAGSARAQTLPVDPSVRPVPKPGPYTPGPPPKEAA